MKIHQQISIEKKEQIVLLYLKGVSKKEISEKTGVSWWHINYVVYKLEDATALKSPINDAIMIVENTEARLINLAERLAKGESASKHEYSVLLSVFPGMDANNRIVF
jgi:hypothetical protein